MLIYIEQIVGIVIFISFSATLLFYGQYRNLQNSKAVKKRIFISTSAPALIIAVSTSFYVQTLFSRLDVFLPRLVVPSIGLEIPQKESFIDVRPHIYCPKPGGFLKKGDICSDIINIDNVTKVPSFSEPISNQIDYWRWT